MTIKKICNVLIELGIISLIIFPPIALGAVQLRYISYIQAGILFIGLVWFIKVLRKGSFTHIFTPFDLPIVLLLLLGIVNLFTSTYAHNTERELYLFLNYAVLYFLVVRQLKTTRRLLGLAFIIVLVGSGEALFGFFQYLKGAKTVLGYATPNIGTLNATYFNHNHFAGFLILVIPIALGLLVGTAHLEKKFFVFLLIGLLGTALILTLSRGGLLSLLLASGLFFGCFVMKDIRQTASWRKYVVLLLLLMICIVGYVAWIGLSPIAHRSLTETFLPSRETFEQEIRFSLWRNALALFKESPLFGSGLGTFEYVFLRYRPEELSQDKQAFYAHNDYLELLVEMGIFGLLIVLWGIFRFYRYTLRGYFRHRDPVLTCLVLGGLTSCTAMFIHSFFDFNLQIPANALLFSIILAMTTATIQLMARGRNRNSSTLQPSEIYHISSSWKFVIVAVAMIVLLGINFRKNIALTYYSQAKTLQGQEQFFPAIQQYQKAKTFDKNNALFYETLGMLYYELGRSTPHSDKWYRLAVREYQKAIVVNSYNPHYYQQLGWVYASLNMEVEAVEAFQKAIAYNPRISFYYENLGNYYLSIDHSKPALEMYQNVVQLNPQRILDLIKRCEEEYDLGYEAYQQIVPQDAESRERFAVLLARRKLWEASKIEYRKAIELSGNQRTYYDALLEACQQQRDYQCMQTVWQELRQQEPDNLDLALKIAESFEKQHLWQQAIKHYEAILRDHPEISQGYERLAKLYQRQERADDALQTYLKFLQREPDSSTTYHDIAAIYRQNKDWTAAIQVYTRALESGLTQADIYSSLGELYLQSGEQKNALEAYNLAVQAGETRIEIYKQLEQIYLAQHNTVAAEFLWETYVLVNKQHPKALFQLVRHYQTHGEWLKAVTLSKELIANAPTNVAYRAFLADLYEQKGMLGETKEQYRKILRIQPENQQAQQKLSKLGG